MNVSEVMVRKTMPTTAKRPRSQIAVMRFTISEPKPMTVVNAEITSGSHTRSKARTTTSSRGAAGVHLLVVARHHVDRVRAADHQEQRRQHERAERDRLAGEHHHAERPDSAMSTESTGRTTPRTVRNDSQNDDQHEHERDRREANEVAPHQLERRCVTCAAPVK